MTHLLSEGELLADTYAFVHSFVEAARKVHGGPLPSMRTTEYLEADALVKLACLLVLAEAYVVCDPHQVIREQLSQAGRDVHGGAEQFWRGWANNHVPFTELQRRREETAA